MKKLFVIFLFTGLLNAHDHINFGVDPAEEVHETPHEPHHPEPKK